MANRSEILLAAAVLSMFATGPALAITRQDPPQSADGRSKLVDPDEQVERWSDQQQARSTRDHFDNGSAASVMRFGNQAGNGVSLRPDGF